MVTSTGQMVSPLDTAQQELIRLQADKRTLLTVYTPQHPDVLKKEQEIRLQQNVITSLRDARSATAMRNEQPTSNVPDADEDISVVQLRSQLQVNTLEMENLAKKEQKLRTEIDQYRSRLNLTPVREQQLTSMQRDYDLLRQHYGDLLKKEQESQLATNLEKRQEGQQFRLADPPNLPTGPSKPKRLKISLIALAAGFAFGCALAFLAEAKNPSFHTEEDVKGRLTLPLVIGVPLFFTPVEQRSRSWKRTVEWFAGCAVVLLVAAAELYVYRHG
jgi:uncharacterized protein involved in exopolysaccharide biosynthesis